MVDKLSKDLNIIQNSDIEVQIDPITADLNIIQKLDDEPNDVGGLTAQELKAKFDEAGNVIKTFINDSLIPQVAAETVSEAQREINEAQRQENEAQRQANEQVRQANEAERKAAEAARSVWEDYDPAKAYVPGNKVYWAGSSYVNKAPCTGVPPNVAANWQMVAKRGETVGSGMTEEDCDERYLQLSGGAMTGPLTVLSPIADDNPAPRWFVIPESIAVTKLPNKTRYYDGDEFISDGMEVKAKDKNGESWRVNNFICQPCIVDVNRGISVLYDRVHDEPLTTKMLFDPHAELVPPFISSTLPTSQHWDEPVFHDGVIFIHPAIYSEKFSTAAYSEDGGRTWKSTNLPSSQFWRFYLLPNGAFLMIASADTSTAAYSEDSGRTWSSATLPAYQTWNDPFFLGDLIFIPPTKNLSSNKAAYSEDNGKTWVLTTLPKSQPWHPPVVGDSTCVMVSSSNSNQAAYSEDGGRTWKSATMSTTINAGPPVYGDGSFVAVSSIQSANTAAYSKDGGKTWKISTLPATQFWRSLFFHNGIFLASNFGINIQNNRTAYSEDGGQTWKISTLPTSQSWSEPIYHGGVLFTSPLVIAGGPNSYSATAAYSADDGKTWSKAELPVSQLWGNPIYHDGLLFLPPSYYSTSTGSASQSSSKAAYSEDYGKTWNLVNLPISQVWDTPIFSGNMSVIPPYSNSATAAYSNNGGKTWNSAVLPTTQIWKPLSCSGGVWLLPSQGSSQVAYSEDGGSTWKSTSLPGVFKRYPALYIQGSWVFIPDITTESATATYCRGVYTLAPLPGDEPAPASAPPLPLEDRINALSAENAALAAAVERGLSL